MGAPVPQSSLPPSWRARPSPMTGPANASYPLRFSDEELKHRRSSASVRWPATSCLMVAPRSDDSRHPYTRRVTTIPLPRSARPVRGPVDLRRDGDGDRSERVRATPAGALCIRIHTAGRVKYRIPSSPSIQFVVEQGGRIRVIRENGVLLPTQYLEVSRTISIGGERGLLGLAFSPDYAVSRRFFINFTDTNGHTVVARFKRSIDNPLVADPATRFDLRWAGTEPFIVQPFANHNGGHLAFGPTSCCTWRLAMVVHATIR